MSSHGANVTLSDRVMGKMGRSYSISEIRAILVHYGIVPIHGRLKLPVFQQLYQLARDRGFTSRERNTVAHNTRAQALVIQNNVPNHVPPRSVPTRVLPNRSAASRRRRQSRQQSSSSSQPARPSNLHSIKTKPENVVVERHLDCSVCLESLSLDSFPQGKLTAECDHELTVCLECLTSCINSQIESTTWDILACPLCPARLPFEVVREYSSEKHLETYDRQATMEAMKGVPNFRQCLAPNCSSGQVHESGDEQPIMTCNVCSFKSCYTHQLPWHPNLSCEEYDRARAAQREENRASVALVKKIGMICPNCSVPGIKVSGCDHMTCPRCQYEYCAQCLASYTVIRKVGNSAHKTTCLHHSNHLPELYLPELHLLMPELQFLHQAVEPNRVASVIRPLGELRQETATRLQRLELELGLNQVPEVRPEAQRGAQVIAPREQLTPLYLHERVRSLRRQRTTAVRAPNGPFGNFVQR